MPQAPLAGTPAGGAPLRVLVVSDQALVADAVRTALLSQGLDAIGAAMPFESAVRAQAVRLRRLGAEAMLVLTDLTRESRITATRALIAELRLPTVVLVTTEDDVLWGAVLDSGATAVLPASVSLDQTTQALVGVSRGARGAGADGDDEGDEGTGVPSARRREEMIRAWQEAVQARAALAGRLSSLSPRELEVLRLLYRGESVRVIAGEFGVSVATVRSQVRSVRRKLQVRSQLAAVSVYAHREVVGSRPDGEAT